MDLSPQPNYPFEFVQADAMTFDLSGYDLIHASPPCQEYSQLTKLNRARRRDVVYPDLIGAMRQRLAGKRYVMENVIGSPLQAAFVLCGSMFGLNVVRHRLFECSDLILCGKRCRHTRGELAIYGKLDGRRVWTRSDGTEVRVARTLEDGRRAMGIDWMSWDELTQAIPPAYTEWIGRRLLAA